MAEGDDSAGVRGNGAEVTGVEVTGAEAPGAEAARTALARARAAARARGVAPVAGGRRTSGAGAGGSVHAPGAGRSGGSGSGSAPDARDPQSLAASMGRLVGQRGWQAPLAVGGVVGRWPQVVGADVAAHCEVDSYADGVLTVRVDSTAWATQVRLLASTLLRRLGEELGEGVVERLVVRGPAGPTWRRGSRSASGGRGPRDTYA